MMRRRLLMSIGEKNLYDRIEYLEFDGSLIFDTGIYGNSSTQIEVQFENTKYAYSEVYLFGCGGRNSIYGQLGTNGLWIYGNGTTYFDTNATGKIFTAEVLPGKTTINNQSKQFVYNGFTTTDYTIQVGGNKTSNVIAHPSFIGRIYYFRMQKNYQQVLDLIPVRRKSDGLECFFDTVSQEFIEPL